MNGICCLNNSPPGMDFLPDATIFQPSLTIPAGYAIMDAALSQMKRLRGTPSENPDEEAAL
jgi:hypothetical protein